MFTLPPPEKRRMVGEPVRKWFFQNFTTQSNDTYIYYLTFKYSFILCLIFSALNWLSYNFGIEFDFGLFAIAIPKEEFNKIFLFSYPLYTSAVLALIVLPFCYGLFRRNVDWKNFDPTWWIDARRKKMADVPMRFRSSKILIFISLIMIPLSSIGWYWFCKNFYLYDSYGYFLLSLFVLPVLMSLFCHIFIISLTTYQRYQSNRDWEEH